MEKSVERGRFEFWRTIIRPPFTFEWRDRDIAPGVELKKPSCRHIDLKKSAMSLVTIFLNPLSLVAYKA